ncbi:hypothetical protein G5S35_22300 [Paraburkholderia tropica]|uniref:hypothetical protein n=1 Tax=Paraburkholderia tropica TaxID=92647 RepID=UPI00160244BC|nr:hypothetical protein [Paraburkholderia tropica]QNB14272.1 hypothetical protein G5S35_22300 [Paraburkholderia tropica]
MSTDEAQEPADSAAEPELSVADFLEDIAPGQVVAIRGLAYQISTSYGRGTVFRAPDLQLHCPSEQCNGLRFFRNLSEEKHHLDHKSYTHFYVTYTCSNCRKFEKTYSLAAILSGKADFSGQVYKFGELPPFGPPVPSRLIKLIGPDRDTFLSGRRCENQGLGIGAFVYYRRVIENQKNRILGEIIKICEKIKAPAEKIATLKAAIEETQFSRALDMAKDAMPESLLIDGHSPIQLLHSALSEGVHALTDAQCLELAGSIRVVLGELSERITQALKDEAELSKALSHLMHFKRDLTTK